MMMRRVPNWFIRDNDPPPPPAERPPRDEWDEGEDDDEAPETPLDEPKPVPIQDPGARPRVPLTV